MYLRLQIVRSNQITQIWGSNRNTSCPLDYTNVGFKYKHFFQPKRNRNTFFYSDIILGKENFKTHGKSCFWTSREKLLLVVSGQNMIGWGEKPHHPRVKNVSWAPVRTISMVFLLHQHTSSSSFHLSLTHSLTLFRCLPSQPHPTIPLFWTTTIHYSIFQVACLHFQTFREAIPKLHLLLSMASGYNISGLMSKKQFLGCWIPGSCKWALRKAPLVDIF